MVIFAAMLRRDFFYDLPPALIAQAPSAERSASRLLLVDGYQGKYRDQVFKDLPTFLEAGDLLVFNDTRVIPARLFGQKQTGGKVEVLIERLMPGDHALAFVRASKSPKLGAWLNLAHNLKAEVVGRHDDLFELRFEVEGALLASLEQQGEIPLPPYIDRAPCESDKARYQTIFAKQPGAVAAPTAGLHFDETLMQRLVEKGIECAYVTLHVGAGTFKPMRVERIEEHQIHQEHINVSKEVCDKIAATRAAGRRVIAVGTTVVRALESAAMTNTGLQAYSGETRIFIYPGYQFKVVDGLVTNFHLPESTLLMLVCAFSGYETVMAAYRHAVEKSYRFFSYGDAMLMWPSTEAKLPCVESWSEI